jgi:predicted chitinase
MKIGVLLKELCYTSEPQTNLLRPETRHYWTNIMSPIEFIRAAYRLRKTIRLQQVVGWRYRGRAVIGITGWHNDLMCGIGI